VRERRSGGQWTASVLLLNRFRTANSLDHDKLGMSAANRYNANRYKPCASGNRALAFASRPPIKVLTGYETRMEVDAFLKSPGVELEDTLEDIERDRATHRQPACRCNRS
jgi:hypothetical protein